MPPDRHASATRGRFDRAVVCFNERAFFEAHEDWEHLWLEADGSERRWLQGLIQLAAAFVHFERGFHARGFVVLLSRSRAKRDGYGGDDRGLDLVRLEDDLRPWYAHAAAVEAGADLRAGAPPLPVLRYRPGVEPAPLPPDVDEP